jgi:hypothetical protein
MFDPNRNDLFGGISYARMQCDRFNLGQGLILMPLFGHLMRPILMAFAPAAPGKAHPGPFAAVEGSSGIDVHTQLFIPKEFNRENWFDRLNTAWWITYLLRLRVSPAILMPVVGSKPFAEVPADCATAKLFAVESPQRLLPVTDIRMELAIEDLSWIQDNWVKGGQLMNSDANFNGAYQAFDFCSHAGSAALSLLTIWGALEQLFAHAKQELRFRASANIACYLEPPGPTRLALHKRIQKLYDARSSAAHSAEKADKGELIESYAILRRCITKIIETGIAPSRNELEQLMFGDAS